ncbi:hypothetical protein ACLOJK_013118 [Asimina triloba]
MGTFTVSMAKGVNGMMHAEAEAEAEAEDRLTCIASGQLVLLGSKVSKGPLPTEFKSIPALLHPCLESSTKLQRGFPRWGEKERGVVVCGKGKKGKDSFLGYS